MSSTPSVIVKKGGFFSSLFKGVFTFLTVTIVCVTTLGIYSLHVVNSNAGKVLGLGDSVAEQLPHWRYVLPPALAEALNDRRAVDYRDSLAVQARLVGAVDDDLSAADELLVEVRNEGREVVTMLALTVAIDDEHGVPLAQRRTYAATPLTFDEDEWRGPLLPGTSRKFTLHMWRDDGVGATPRVEITELRVAEPLPEALPALPAPPSDDTVSTSEPIETDAF